MMRTRPVRSYLSRGLSCGALLALAALVPGAATEAPAKPIDTVPVYQEPMHRLVFENRLARVLDVRIPPGVTTGYHQHGAPLAGVAVAVARTRSQRLGEAPGAVEERGEVPHLFDNWGGTLPYTHRVTNEDSVELHYVVGEWLASSGVEAKIEPADSGLELVKEGPTARVWRATVPPHATLAAHVHTSPGLSIVATAGTLRWEGDAPEASGGAGAGSWSFRRAGARHLLRNDGDTAVTIYEIDWR